jgi:hypothetical protein
MKLYKLWLEIEEYDAATGVYRNLSEEGGTEPVPVAVFPSLDEARAYAEAFAMDGGRPRNPWLHLLTAIN